MQLELLCSRLAACLLMLMWHMVIPHPSPCGFALESEQTSNQQGLLQKLQLCGCCTVQPDTALLGAAVQCLPGLSFLARLP